MNLTEARAEVAAWLEACDSWNRPDGFHAAIQTAVRTDPPPFDYRTITIDALRALMDATAPTQLDAIPITARNSDPTTSHTAIEIAKVRATAARGKLLLTYGRRHHRGWTGLTAEAAVRVAGLTSQRAPWKRVSDLKLAGLLAPTGEHDIGSSGAPAEILEITPAGLEVLASSCPDEWAEIVGGN